MPRTTASALTRAHKAHQKVGCTFDPGCGICRDYRRAAGDGYPDAGHARVPGPYTSGCNCEPCLERDVDAAEEALADHGLHLVAR